MSRKPRTRKSGRPSRGPGQEPKTRAVSFRTSEELHDLLKEHAAASGWSTAEEISQRLARTFRDNDLLNFLAWGKGHARADLVRLVMEGISTIEGTEIAHGNAPILDVKDWSADAERSAHLFGTLEALLHMVLIDGISIIRGREETAKEFLAIHGAAQALKDDPASAPESSQENLARLVLLTAGYRCKLPIVVTEQHESEWQALERAKAEIEKMRVRPSQLSSRRVMAIMRRVEQKQAEGRAEDFAPEVAPLLEAAHGFISFTERGDYLTVASSPEQGIEVIRNEARKLAETILRLLDDKRSKSAAAG